MTSTNGQWNKSACSSTMKWTGCPKINRNSEELPHVIKIKAKRCALSKKGKDTSFLFSLLRIPFQTKTRPVSRFPALFQTIYNNYFAGFQELFRPTI